MRITLPIKLRLVGFLCIQSHSLVCQMKTTPTRQGFFGCQCCGATPWRFTEVLLSCWKGLSISKVLMKHLSLHLWFDLEALTYVENLLPLEMKWENILFSNPECSKSSVSPQNSARKRKIPSSSSCTLSCAFIVFSRTSQQTAHWHFSHSVWNYP